MAPLRCPCSTACRQTPPLPPVWPWSSHPGNTTRDYAHSYPCIALPGFAHSVRFGVRPAFDRRDVVVWASARRGGVAVLRWRAVSSRRTGVYPHSPGPTMQRLSGKTWAATKAAEPCLPWAERSAPRAAVRRPRPARRTPARRTPESSRPGSRACIHPRRCKILA